MNFDMREIIAKYRKHLALSPLHIRERDTAEYLREAAFIIERLAGELLKSRAALAQPKAAPQEALSHIRRGPEAVNSASAALDSAADFVDGTAHWVRVTRSAAPDSGEGMPEKWQAALSQKPQPCACRFEWRPTPDFSGAPPVQLDECGFHAQQRRSLSLRGREGVVPYKLAQELDGALCAFLNDEKPFDEANAAVNAFHAWEDQSLAAAPPASPAGKEKE